MDDTRRVRSPIRGYVLEELSVGMNAEYGRTVSEADLVLFAAVSGDANPIHMNAEYAAKTRFGGRIAHGILSASYISALVAMKLPGPGTVYLQQNLRFRHPVRIGDTVVVEGDALVMVPRRADTL